MNGYRIELQDHKYKNRVQDIFNKAVKSSINKFANNKKINCEVIDSNRMGYDHLAAYERRSYGIISAEYITKKLDNQTSIPINDKEIGAKTLREKHNANIIKYKAEERFKKYNLLEPIIKTNKIDNIEIKPENKSAPKTDSTSYIPSSSGNNNAPETPNNEIASKFSFDSFYKYLISSTILSSEYIRDFLQINNQIDKILKYFAPITESLANSAKNIAQAFGSNIQIQNNISEFVKNKIPASVVFVSAIGAVRTIIGIKNDYNNNEDSSIIFNNAILNTAETAIETSASLAGSAIGVALATRIGAGPLALPVIGAFTASYVAGKLIETSKEIIK